MYVEFDKAFYKSLDKVNDPTVKKKIEKIIIEIDNAKSLNEIRNIKKLIGFQYYYRIRLGNYRIGFELKNGVTLRFIVIAHRKDIYKVFP